MYEIYERLLELNHVTTADVCRATGLKESSISNWKRRGTACSKKTAMILANYFNVSIDYLMTGKEPFDIGKVITSIKKTHTNKESDDFSVEKIISQFPYLNDDVFMDYMERLWFFPKEERHKVYEYIDLIGLGIKQKKDNSLNESSKTG